MKFGYAILYVDDVERTVSFYERAFGLKRKFVQQNEYGELATGATKLAFAARQFVMQHLPGALHRSGPGEPLAPCEIALIADDVGAAYERALAAGAEAVHAPEQKPWGQIVAYVRDGNGFLVELCTAMP